MENLVNGNFDVHIQLFVIVAALLSWRDGQGLEIRWTLNWQYSGRDEARSSAAVSGKKK